VPDAKQCKTILVTGLLLVVVSGCHEVTGLDPSTGRPIGEDPAEIADGAPADAYESPRRDGASVDDDAAITDASMPTADAAHMGGLDEPACNACEEHGCRDVDGLDLYAACFLATGTASDGPGAGMPRSDLCKAVLHCARVTGCALTDPQPCYCGEGVSDILCLAGNAAGPCKGVIEVAAESTSTALIAERLADPAYASGAAFNLLRYCEAPICGAACAGGHVDLPDAGPPPDPNGCSDLFDENILPDYELEISAEEWAKLEDEFLNWAQREQAGLDPNPYHPVRFRYQGGPWMSDVMVRLKGQSSWHETVALDANPKMQFVISFNEVDHQARFHGVRKVELDMPRNDWSFLRQRLAGFYLRSIGIEGQCCNNVRLTINGSYYGLYANLERTDKEYLQRNFPGQAGGDLWEGGRTIKTNEMTFSWTRIVQFWLVTTAEELDQIADLAYSIKEWAAEAMLNDADGYYGGRHNFYLYDHPTRGFVWLAHDMDATFDFRPVTGSPVLWSRAKEPAPHYLMVMDDPIWLGRYVEGLAEARAGYDPDVLIDRVSVWANQIAAAAAADPHRPFSMSQHNAAVSWVGSSIRGRAAFIDNWLDCWRNGGPDVDGDGFDACHDCADGDASVHPGAAELCNLLDDDCDGRIDEDQNGTTTCPGP